MTVKAPVDGAVRVSKLAPASSEDAFAYVAGELRRQGWNVLDIDVRIDEPFSPWVMVHCWAISPTTQARQ